MSTSTTTEPEVSVWQELRNNIFETEVWMRSQIKSFLEEFGITQKQLAILRILKAANNEPMSTKEIQSKMMDRKSDTSRLVDRLIEKELARKRQDPNDGRLVQVFIKYEGLRLIAQVDDHLHQLDQRFELLNEEEAGQLNALLEKARA